METNTPQRRNNLWTLLTGLSIIAIGVVFLVQNFTSANLGNWWALFVLFPAVGIGARAYQVYQDNGKRLTPAVIGMATTAVLILASGLLLMFNLDLSRAWPVFILIVGLGILARVLAGNGEGNTR